ncbi:sensor histidine kinase [Myceligenerans xiligouense]|uniref:Two-component system sensor histidine kinase DesK n=1 Tax=Myceligenerans xiligouense TaxID=253184 RepID=A0A3N4Z946_9MICO|nr:histidine kinase [Myceligenerans xiligouense]RPF21902.1 two-component system sensor histidine kinase DesK [Myceligenerans xiligouense]
MNAGPARRVPGRLPAAPWTTRAGRMSRRRFRTLNLSTALPLFVAVGAILVARQAQSWQDVVVLGLGLAAVVVAFERWTVGEIARVAVPCLAVAAVVWPYGAFLIDGDAQSAYYSLAVVGGLTVPQLPRRRVAAAIALTAYVGAIGALSLVTGGEVDATGVILDVILPTGITAVVIGVMFPNKGFYDVVAELEESREREAELAVMRERMRFAGDLHDIQGHTLHVVKLKIALAQKLLHSDTERVERELREVYALVSDTITQTKELAYGQRKLNLTAELENARNLLEAAGARVRVERRAEIDSPPIDLLAQVLRETTTNILRHSRATLVRIELAARSITVSNDGVAADDAPPELRGLATLGRRVADAGGELTTRRADGRFLTRATFPATHDGGHRTPIGEERP